MEIETLKEAEKEMQRMGVDTSGISIMAPKALHKVVKLKDLSPPAANIIKQEILSRGGEAAVAYGTINHSVDKTDVLILGTDKQIAELAKKLEEHPFGLPEVAGNIKEVIKNFEGHPPPMKIGNRNFSFGERTFIMGVLNVTPDSFSDGGKFINLESALEHARAMIRQGADIIDVGGESTRPGANPLDVKEEINRTIPVIKKLAQEGKTVISIDTRKGEVAQAALEAGAHMVNDVSGLRADPKTAKIVAEYGVPVIIMHMQGTPQDMQENPHYEDLISEIMAYLKEGIEIATFSGISKDKIMVDPGIGFGKTVEHNLEIMRRLSEFKSLGRPILIGTSKKSVIGQILGLPVDERLEGTGATVALTIAHGADIIRVHDVAAMARVAKMTDAIVRPPAGGKEGEMIK